MVDTFTLLVQRLFDRAGTKLIAFLAVIFVLDHLAVMGALTDAVAGTIGTLFGVFVGAQMMKESKASNGSSPDQPHRTA